MRAIRVDERFFGRAQWTGALAPSSTRRAVRLAGAARVPAGRATRRPPTPRWRRRPSGWPIVAGRRETLAELDAAVSVCRACPRLVEWREQVAVAKRKSFAAQPYWGRPVPGWGSVRAAGARCRARARGARRQPYRPGVHRRPVRRHALCGTAPRGPGQLAAVRRRRGRAGSSIDTRVVAAVRCAPPGNAPTPAERQTCVPWLDAEWRLVGPHVKVIVALGGFAWRAALQMVRAAAARSARRCRASGTARRPHCRPRTATCYCWAAITRASRTPSPAG